MALYLNYALMAVDKNSSQKEDIPCIMHPPTPHVVLFITIKIIT
jgi:hypothetical protein